jgi:type IV secretion system protein VirD4
MNYTDNHTSYSRQASRDEIIKSLYRIALDDKNPERGGLPLFADKEAVYVEDKDSHTLVIGSTGSKKTRLIGMPALRIYAMAGESFIATDPKAELYKKTYQLLNERGYKIIVINLRDPLRSNAWNPLRIPYLQYCNGQKDKAKEFVIDMASCIAKEGNARDPYWENSSADLLAGLILLLFEYAKENEIHFKSLRALRTQAFKNVRLINSENKNGEKDIAYIQENFLRYLDNTSFLFSLLSGTAEVTEVTRSCIISEFDQAMRPFFCQDNLVDMLSGSDFELSGIGKTKTAVFLIIPDENTVYNKLISVFVKQCYTELLREAEKHPKNRLPIRVNFLLDEFSNLPAIGDFPAMITASRSRNIRFNLFIQSQTQLVDRYGHNANTIKGNCENWVFLHSRELPLLNEIVGLSGMKNSCLPLVSVSTLQTLDKDKGEAFILNKRLNPYITALLDIDEYPNMVLEEQDIPYPENTCKANAVFNFKRHCDNMPEKYMVNDDEILAPIFTSVIPSEEELKKIAAASKYPKTFKENSASGTPIDLSMIGSGWHGLVLPIINEINLYNEKHQGKEITIGQIKEKFGTLGFYASGSPEYIEGMIAKAEKESVYICEICGARGTLTQINGLWATLCEHHIQAKKEANHDNKLFARLYRKAMHKLQNA